MYFNNQMFNPQYVNRQFYQDNLSQIQQYNFEQDKEVANAVRAIHDLLKSIKKLDNQHQEVAFWACLAEIARENNWR